MAGPPGGSPRPPSDARPDAAGPVWPAEFAASVQAARGVLAQAREEVVVEEGPGPRRLAASAVTFHASVSSEAAAWAHGRLVLLHDPDRVQEWGGPTRVVVHAAAEVEAELGADPMLPDVAWRWLVEALARHDAVADELGGTVTRQASVRYGRLHADEEDPATAEVEVRASWTPGTPPGLGPHAAAWVDLVADAAGLPPEGVCVLRPARR